MSTDAYLHHRTDPGQERDHNEDCLAVIPLSDDSQLLVVCDGMGGHEAGDVASRVAVDAIQRFFEANAERPSKDRIYFALKAANEAVLAAAETLGAPSMGTTAVICHLVAGQAWVGWVGDSRFYRLRRGAILDRTEDHTRVRKMIEMKILDEAAARHHPDAHILTQALGGGSGAQQAFKPGVWSDPVRLEPGDVFLLCSDGLFDMIEDDELYGMMASQDIETAVDTLVDEANRRGGPDNISVIAGVFGLPEVPPAFREILPSQEVPEALADGTPTPELPPTATVQPAPWQAPAHGVAEVLETSPPWPSEAPLPPPARGLPPRPEPRSPPRTEPRSPPRSPPRSDPRAALPFLGRVEAARWFVLGMAAGLCVGYFIGSRLTAEQPSARAVGITTPAPGALPAATAPVPEGAPLEGTADKVPAEPNGGGP